MAGYGVAPSGAVGSWPANHVCERPVGLYVSRKFAVVMSVNWLPRIAHQRNSFEKTSGQGSQLSRCLSKRHRHPSGERAPTASENPYVS